MLGLERDFFHDLTKPLFSLVALGAQVVHIANEKERLEFFDDGLGQIMLHIA